MCFVSQTARGHRLSSDDYLNDRGVGVHDEFIEADEEEDVVVEDRQRSVESEENKVVVILKALGTASVSAGWEELKAREGKEREDDKQSRERSRVAKKKIA